MSNPTVKDDSVVDKTAVYDALVIGGGFYGCAIATELSQQGLKVTLVEQEEELMQRASYTNQARIHQGYHYPRSILTALRSRVNFDRFVKQFEGCVFDSFDKYYAIASNNSKVNAEQFKLFCRRIGAPIEAAPKEVTRLFNPELIEQVFRVKEFAFDTKKLRLIMQQLLEESKVDLKMNCQVTSIAQSGKWMQCIANQPEEISIGAKRIFNCTYSGINRVLSSSGLDVIPLKHELTEMTLLDMPKELEDFSITVMDGPFFSIMPFPARKQHILSHVRYTPHFWWLDNSKCELVNSDGYIKSQQYREEFGAKSYQLHMLKDAARYMPVLQDCTLGDSLWEIKTILPQSEVDDSRPILFRRDSNMPEFISVMGGKIDNIFDIQEKIGELDASSSVNSTIAGVEH